MSQRKLIAKNTIFNAAASFANTIIGFLIFPFMILKLGTVEFGMFGISLVFAFGGLITLLEPGLHTSITKHIAEYMGEGERDKVRNVLGTSFLILFGIGILAFLATFSLAEILQPLFSISKAHKDTFRTALYIFFGSYLFLFPGISFLATLEGLQRFDIVQGTTTICEICKALLIVLFLILDFGFLSLVVITVSMQLIQNLVYAYSCFHLLSIKKLRWIHFSKETALELWKVSKFVYLTRISSIIYEHADRVLIGIFGNPTMMTFYEALIRLPRFIRTFMGFAQGAIVPAASRLKALGDQHHIRMLYCSGFRFIFAFSVPIIMAAVYFAEPFLVQWIDPKFGHLAPMLQVLMLWNLFLTLNFGVSILYGINRRLKEVATLSWVSTIVRAAAAALLIPHYGLWGFITAALLSHAIQPFFLRIFFQEFSVSTYEFFKDVTITLILTMILYAIFNVFNKYSGIENMLDLIIQGAFWCLIYWGLLYFSVLRREDKEIVQELVRAWGKT